MGLDTQTLSDQMMSRPTRARLDVRRYGAVNWLGLQTLVTREVMRFMKVSAQTLIAPLMQTLLFLAIFSLAWGARPWGATEIPFVSGLTAGLVMMAVISNAFMNTSSSLVIAKVQGNAVDFLMPPLSATELTIAFIAGAVARGLIVGLASLLAAAFFAPIAPTHLAAAIYFPLIAAITFAAIGLIGGIWADKFDNLAAVTNFVITPLTFLSGTFYSIDALPEPWSTVGHWNPVFYLIDGFRFGMIGHADFPVWQGALITGAIAAGLCLAAWMMLKSGYKLRA
jgi:ABC-2 type transport system permease protein